jgi:hypothetical protein
LLKLEKQTTKQSAATVRDLINSRYPDAVLAFVDLFAMDCLMHARASIMLA